MDNVKNTALKLKLFSSWSYVAVNNSEINELLSDRSNLVPGGKHPCLWKTRNKYVLKLTLADGKEVVYKAPLCQKGIHKYLFRPGPYGMEAFNFDRLAKAGLPMVKLIASGEKRCCFVLKDGFVMTEYASGFSNGRDFIDGEALENEKELINEFVCRNFVFLAKMHALGIIHRGFTPANLLYRKRTVTASDNNLLDLLWIDVASCQKPFAGIGLHRGIARDIALFFHYFNFSRDEKLRYIRVYCSSDPKRRFSPEKLLELVDKNPVR